MHLLRHIHIDAFADMSMTVHCPNPLNKIISLGGSIKFYSILFYSVHSFLCFARQNLNAHPRPASQDLAGFWDMLQLSIENISLKFDELHQLKANGWKPLTPPEIQVTIGSQPPGGAWLG